MFRLSRPLHPGSALTFDYPGVATGHPFFYSFYFEAPKFKRKQKLQSAAGTLRNCGIHRQECLLNTGLASLVLAPHLNKPPYTMLVRNKEGETLSASYG